MREIDARSNMFYLWLHQASTINAEECYELRGLPLIDEGYGIDIALKSEQLKHTMRLLFDMTDGQISERLNDLQVHGLPVELPGSPRLSSQVTLKNGGKLLDLPGATIVREYTKTQKQESSQTTALRELAPPAVPLDARDKIVEPHRERWQSKR
jgi:hypothetical protein